MVNAILSLESTARHGECLCHVLFVVPTNCSRRHSSRRYNSIADYE